MRGKEKKIKKHIWGKTCPFGGEYRNRYRDRYRVTDRDRQRQIQEKNKDI